MKNFLLILLLAPMITQSQVFNKKGTEFSGKLDIHQGIFLEQGNFKGTVNITTWIKITSFIGEPISEFNLLWEWDKDINGKPTWQYTWRRNPGEVCSGSNCYIINETKLAKYPDLLKQFKYLTPLPDLKIEFPIQFRNYKDVKCGFYDSPIATVDIDALFELPERAGIKQSFSLPNSPNWEDFFVSTHINCSFSDNKGNSMSGQIYREDEKKAANRLLVENCSSIYVGTPRNVRWKWPEADLKNIFDEYARREDKAKKPASTTQKSNKDDFWNSTANSNNSAQNNNEDFWSSTTTPEILNTTKLEQADQYFAQKKWTEARELYKEVATSFPKLSYAGSKVKYIDKLMAYKPKEGNTFTDTRDGNVYKTVKIGNQVWMAENLKYLPSVVGPKEFSRTSPRYYVYDYNGTSISSAKVTNNYLTYGVLYNWMAALNGAKSSDANPSGVQGACPCGWHLPSKTEWDILFDFFTKNEFYDDIKLKFCGFAKAMSGSLPKSQGGVWENDNTFGVPGNTDLPEKRNVSGFSALPGGYWTSVSYSNGGGFESLGRATNFWTSSSYDKFLFWTVSLDYDKSCNSINKEEYFNYKAISIRCLKD